MSMIRYFNQRDKVTDKMVDAHMKTLTEEYKKANVTIRNQLEVIHRKYSTDGVLSYAEMTKYNRLANLQKDVNSELGRISGITTRNTAKLAGDVYNESFFRTAFALEQGAGMDLGFGKLPTKQVEAAITNPYREIALDTHKQRVRNNIRRDITQGIIQGESYPKMAKRVQSSLEDNLNNAERIARTEAHRAREVASLDSMEQTQEMGVYLQKMWVSAIDNRTRDTHAAMDGQRVAVDEDFVSPSGATGPAPGELNEAGEVINCRCTSIAIIEGYEPEARRIRGENAVRDDDGNIIRYDSGNYKTYREHAEAKGWPMKYKGPEPRLEPAPALRREPGLASENIVEEPEIEIAGVSKGNPMTVEDARGNYAIDTVVDKPSANPNYKTAREYRINCQTAVVAHEARFRGYNVIAKGNTKGSKLKLLSRDTTLAWYNPITKAAPGLEKLTDATTAKKTYKALQARLIEGQRYNMEWTWKGRGSSGHIVSVGKEQGKVFLFDPQSGTLINEQAKLEKYFSRFKYKTTSYGSKFETPPKLLRVDDLQFDAKMVNDILEKG